MFFRVRERENIQRDIGGGGGGDGGTTGEKGGGGWIARALKCDTTQTVSIGLICLTFLKG